MSIVFLRDIDTNFLPTEDTDKEQSNLFKKLSDLSKFMENVRFLIASKVI